MSKDSLKYDKYFTSEQIRKRKRKSGGYEVTPHVEIEVGGVTSTVQTISGYKLQQ